MNKKDTERAKKRIQKVEKLTAEFNERITKELTEISNMLSTKSDDSSKSSKRKTPRRSKSDGNGDSGLLSEGD